MNNSLGTQPDQGNSTTVVVVREATTADISVVRELLTREYYRQGYITQEALENTQHTLFPFLDKEVTTTFIAESAGEVYASMSLVLDSENGFPMDIVFKSDLDRFREQGLRLAEDCYMVVSAEKRQQLRQQNRDMETLTKLFRAVVQRAIEAGVDILCGETNPKHALIYTALGFEAVGSERPNPLVNGAPALGKALDLRRLRELQLQHPLLRFVLT